MKTDDNPPYVTAVGSSEKYDKNNIMPEERPNKNEITLRFTENRYASNEPNPIVNPENKL